MHVQIVISYKVVKMKNWHQKNQGILFFYFLFFVFWLNFNLAMLLIIFIIIRIINIKQN